MRVMIIDGYGQDVVKETNLLPRIGDSIDMFSNPFPKVESVVLWPTRATLDDLDIGELVDVIVLVK
jgi:hypothetical protein